MPRSRSVKAADSDPPLHSLERTLPPKPQSPSPSRQFRYHPSASFPTAAAEEVEAHAQSYTYDIELETDAPVVGYTRTDFPAFPADKPHADTVPAHQRWHPFVAPRTRASPTSHSPATPRDRSSPSAAAPLTQQRLSRSTTLATPPSVTPSETNAAGSGSPTNQASPTEQQSPSRNPQRIQLGGPSRPARRNIIAAANASSIIRGPHARGVSLSGRGAAPAAVSSRTGTPRAARSPSTSSPPLSVSPKPQVLQRIPSRQLLPAPDHTDTAPSSVVSSLNSVHAANLIPEQEVVFSRSATLNRSPTSQRRQLGSPPLHDSPPLPEPRQHTEACIDAASPHTSLTNEANIPGMGLSFSSGANAKSPSKASTQRTPTKSHRQNSGDRSRPSSKGATSPSANEGSRKASRHSSARASGPAAAATTPNAASPLARGPEVDDEHWVFQRPPNNQRTFYFEEDNLEFSSQFDSGNLIQVERIGTFSYRMYTAMDCGNSAWQTNNRQWFHFSVRGASKGVVVTVCFVGMMHSNMFTYDWMPVMAVVPSRPEYTRVSGKCMVEALETMPETPGYPLLVHKTVSRDDADSDGGGDEDELDGDAAALGGATGNGNAGGVAFSISPVNRQPGPGAKKKKKNAKKKCIAMNLTFSFKIEADIPVTYTPPQGRPDSPAMYIATNHPYSYATLQRNLTAWQDAARRSNATRALSVQAPERQAANSRSAPAEAAENHRTGGDSPTTVVLNTSGKPKKPQSSPNAGEAASSHATVHSGTYFHREVMCKSLEGRDVTLLTISDRSRMTMERAPLISKEDGLPHSSARGLTERPFAFSGKQYVVLTARVHPGECPASHLMHGCIDFLMNSTDSRAAALRHNFVFCVMPMLNPDGVIRGHSRVDSNGVDLNRMYRDPSRKRHPVPYAIRSLIRALGSRVALFIDMHSHANKRGTFFYGNSMDSQSEIENLLYAKLVSLNTPYLDFRSCNFSEANMFAMGRSGKCKDSSSRVVVFTEAGIVHGYTIETSPVMADAINPVAPLAAHAADEAGMALPTPPPTMHTPATFADTGRAMLLALLDLRNINPTPRLPFTQFHSTRGLTLWLQRQLQIETAEMLFAQSFKTHGKDAQATTSDSGNVLLAAIMKSMTPDEYVDKITIKKARLLPRVTYSGVREFLPIETATALLAQTAPTGPPRSLLYPNGSPTGTIKSGAPAALAAAMAAAPRRGQSPMSNFTIAVPPVTNSSGNGSSASPPAIVATRRRSKAVPQLNDAVDET